MLSNRYASRRQHNIKILQQELKSLDLSDSKFRPVSKRPPHFKSIDGNGAFFHNSWNIKHETSVDGIDLKPLEGFRIENSDESI